MIITDILDNNIFRDETKANLKQSFNNGIPYRHVVIDNFLSNQFALELYKNFPALHAMKTSYNGLNEKKSESSDFTKLHTNFNRLHETLSSSTFKGWIESLTGISSLQTINDRLGYGLHQGGNKSFLDIHIDYNIHPLNKLYRKLNLILFLNELWQDEWGGKLELWDDKVKNCIQSITPSFNRCVIFECSDISYHGYNKVHVQDEITRKSYYQYFFIPIHEVISFHDTVFKPRPKESMLKKIATPVKEFAKNSAKRILLKMGLKDFLK